jgi:phosphotransferase system enzyme I (PtsI)
LFRTEFLLAVSDGPKVDEEAQLAVYRRLIEDMSPRPVTIRTFDLDETDALPALGLDGWFGRRAAQGSRRGIRLLAERPEMVRTQLRALLRAAPYGVLRILLPFVSSADEVRQVRRMIAEETERLVREGIVVPRVPLGVMIEVPAAALTADLLAREADFFTIGTNDLIQFTLAVDRADDRGAGRYEPLHPAVLRLLVMIRRAARRHGIPVSLCGEMAADAALLLLLVGLGLSSFSMTAGAIPIARQVLREHSSDDLRRLARQILRLSTVDEIEQTLYAAIGAERPRRNDVVTQAKE